MLFGEGLRCLKCLAFFRIFFRQLTGFDEEVLELEHLKHPPVTAAAAPVRSGANTKEEILPQLEKQLEEEAQASASITSSDEDDAGGDDADDVSIFEMGPFSTKQRL